MVRRCMYCTCSVRDPSAAPIFVAIRHAERGCDLCRSTRALPPGWFVSPLRGKFGVVSIEESRKKRVARQLVGQDGGRMAEIAGHTRCKLPRYAHQLASA